MHRASCLIKIIFTLKQYLTLGINNFMWSLINRDNLFNDNLFTLKVNAKAEFKEHGGETWAPK